MQRISYPFANFIDPRIWHEYEYDYLGRKIEETAPYIDLSYNYNTPKTVIVTDNLRNLSSSKTYDALGRITNVTDAGGDIDYDYDITGSGNDLRYKTTIATNGAITTVLSDLWGNRRSIEEPNAGKITSDYNGFNELVKQEDARGNVTNYQYDKLGRVTQKQFVSSEGALQNIIYQYDGNTAGSIGKVCRIRMGGIDVEGFSYDALGRLMYHSKVIDNTIYTYEYIYNSNGQLYTLTYPAGFSVAYSYDSSGKLDEIRRSDDNSLIYRVNSRSSRYHTPTQGEYGNGVVTNYTYNTYGLLTRIQAGNKVPILIGGGGGTTTLGGGPITEPAYTVDSAFLNYRYAYNDKGLMVSRSESVINRLEQYTYDNLDRLTGITSSGTGLLKPTTQTLSYHNNGNITGNSTTGGYTYGVNGSKPHAVTKIEIGKLNPISTNPCDVTYNFFNQPTQITEGDYQLDLFYGANQQRQKMETYNDSIKERTRYYINKRYEQENDHITNTTRDFNYIYGDHGIVALYISTYPTPPPGGGGGGQTSCTETATDSIYYVHTDHLGSYCVITNAGKKVRQRSHFDPWGNVVNRTPSLNFALTNRGFTGHEHYPDFKIINMNGRLYDPVIGRFFSPDPLVQIPDFTQNYNRYSYCLNNPLQYIDPSGQNFTPVNFTLLDIFLPARVLSEAFTWIDDKMNGNTRGGYFPLSYLTGQTSPYPLTPYSPVNSVSYGQPGYIPSSIAWFGGLNNAGRSYGSFEGLNADNTITERFDYEWYWAGGTIGKLKRKASGKEVGMIVPWGQWYARQVTVGGGEKGQNFSLLAMYTHFQIGGRNPMTINMSSIDFSGTTQRALGLTGTAIGKPVPVNLFNAGRLHPAALAFGRVKMINHGNDQFSIVSDESSRFDFDPLIDRGTTWRRNAANLLGAAINYNMFYLHFGAPLIPMLFGGEYDVYFIGTTYIPK